MWACERDEEIRIPRWYMKLPISIMEKLSKTIMIFIHLFPQKKRKKQTGKIQFYI